jgi:hypothetical protein
VSPLLALHGLPRTGIDICAQTHFLQMDGARTSTLAGISSQHETKTTGHRTGEIHPHAHSQLSPRHQYNPSARTILDQITTAAHRINLSPATGQRR